MIIIFGLSLVACKKPDEGGTKPTEGPTTTVPGGKGEVIDFSERLKQKTEINVWLDDESGEYARALIEAFNATEEGADITVIHRHEGSVESRERLKTVGPTGGGPDVFQFPHDHLANAILEDLVYPLPESTKQLVEERSHELGTKIATVQYDETTGQYGPGSNAEARLFAMPTSIESVGLYYNKDLISPSEVPTTMEELITKAGVWNNEVEDGDGSGLTRGEKGHFFFTTSSHWADSYFMQGFYSSFGFRPFGPDLDDKNNVGFTSPEAKAALNWFVDSLKPVVTGDTTDTAGKGNEFEAKNIPLIIAGPWNIEGYKKAGINLGIAQMPTINGKAQQTYAGAIMTAVYKYSNKLDAATRFVEFLNSDEAMALLYEHKGKLPALKANLLDNIPGVTADELLMAMSQQLETSIPMPTIPEVQHYWGPGENMIKAVWAGTSIEDATQEAKESYEALAKLAG